MTRDLSPDIESNSQALGAEAHVWLARPSQIVDPELLDLYRSILSRDEREREERLQGEEQRRSFRVSHALVRISLSHYAEVAPEDWRFEIHEHGRPEITGPERRHELRFNLSHTRGLVGVVVTRGIDCGLDVERVGRVKDLARVSQRVFSDAEIRNLEARESEAARHGRFTDFWTLKEAYVKARGLGFQLPFREITADLEHHPGKPPSMSFAGGIDDSAEEWQLHLEAVSRDEGGDYRVAVALRRGSSAERLIVTREAALDPRAPQRDTMPQ